MGPRVCSSGQTSYWGPRKVARNRTETWTVVWTDDGTTPLDPSPAQDIHLIRRSKKMKSRLLFVALLAVAVMMTASTAFAATPLKGSWDSSEIPTFVPAPPPDAVTMYVDGDASGNATHLGKYTAKFAATVNLACGCSVGDTVHFIAANGDSLYGVGAGFWRPF